jgi:UDPglucose 6-dehydrogenase
MKKIVVIGTGYVGLVSGAGLSDFGNNVTCVDISKKIIEDLNDGKIPIFEPGLVELINRNVKSGRLKFSTKISEEIKSADVVFIAVGTPENDDGDANLDSISSVAKLIGENIKQYLVVCTKSTVPVGTGNLISTIITKFNIKKVKFDYVSNPEFLREGSAVNDFLWPDRVVIGAKSKQAFSIMKDVYRPLYINEKPILHTNIETAEMIKYASNAFLALKISYINEVANLCEKVGADVHLVTKGMGQDGRISSKFLHPGPGYGGSCFPKDTKAFAVLAKKNGLSLKTIDASIEVNIHQKVKMFRKLSVLLKNNLSKKNIAVLGLSFKPNTDDIRESSSIVMIDSILKNNGSVNAYDPIANEKMKDIFPDINYHKSWQNACAGADGAVIMTEWNEFRALDLELLKNILKTPVILDTRNILSIEKLKELKFSFDNIGRNTIK